jgi:hypothetical protein
MPSSVDLTTTPESRCTAEIPRCSDCVANDIVCVYENNKKDRMRELTSQRQILLDLTHKLRLDANTSDRQLIESTLYGVCIIVGLHTGGKHYVVANSKHPASRTTGGQS